MEPNYFAVLWTIDLAKISIGISSFHRGWFFLIINFKSTFISAYSGSSSSYRNSAYSFIFSFKNRDDLEPFKLQVKETSRAIYDHGSYGPTFGGGFDIYIASNAGSNTNSYNNLGGSYVQVEGYKYGSSNTRSLLAGSYNFHPHEVEVFYQTHKNWHHLNSASQCCLLSAWSCTSNLRLTRSWDSFQDQ